MSKDLTIFLLICWIAFCLFNLMEGIYQDIKENSIKSFQSMSNLRDYDYEYNEIIVVRQNKQKDEDYKFYIFNGQIITNTISAIKNNLYFFGTFILYSIGFTFHTKHSFQV